MDAESKKNNFNTTRLVWSMHPERNQAWRDAQTMELGAKKAAQECDTEFLSSGNTVVEMTTIEEYRKFTEEPEEIRGHDNSFWIWERPDASKNYIVSADVARGDGSDFSAFQIIDPVSLTQIAEYKGAIGTKEFGNMLVAVATEYNSALLVIENATYGWAVIQQVIDRGYQNMFYSNADMLYVDANQHMTNKLNASEKKKVPGFTNSTKTRPLIIEKLGTCIREKTLRIKSKRFIDELSVFVWHNNKAEAMRGYNDDLILSMCIGLWVQDTALRLRSESMDMNRSLLNNIKKVGNSSTSEVFSNATQKNKQLALESWSWQTNKIGVSRKEDLNWLM